MALDANNSIYGATWFGFFWLQQPIPLDRQITLHQRRGQLFAGDIQDHDPVAAQGFVRRGALFQVTRDGGGADRAGQVVDFLVDGCVQCALACVSPVDVARTNEVRPEYRKGCDIPDAACDLARTAEIISACMLRSSTIWTRGRLCHARDFQDSITAGL